MDLHVLGCAEHGLIISEKCLTVCVWQKFLASVVQELTDRISWNFIFSVILTWINVYQILVKIA